MGIRGKLFAFPGGGKKGKSYPEELDFSLDSGIKQSLLEAIREKYFNQLAEADLADISAAGIPFPVRKTDEEEEDNKR